MTFPRTALLSAALLMLPIAAHAQDSEGLLPTQTLVRADSKDNVIPMATAITLEINNKPSPLLSLTPVKPSGVQVALLIDDGLSRSAGIQLEDLRSFANTLPRGTEVLIGYMRSGGVEVVQPFTTDYAAAAAKIRIPTGIPGLSASPYFCLSDFVKRWPGASRDEGPGDANGGGAGKARFAIMITNGVDPYNGSTRITNQDSPYVAAAITDAQRAGVAVYSIYYRDAGFRGGNASFSGQSYLQQLADGTGGESFYQGLGSPVSLKPFFDRFNHAIAETYVATFNASTQAGGREHLVRLKMNTSTPKLKLRHPDEVRPGNQEAMGPR